MCKWLRWDKKIIRVKETMELRDKDVEYNSDWSVTYF